MKYCNSHCQHLLIKIIECGGEILGFDYRCMAQKDMPRVTLDECCPYDKITERIRETNIEINELKQELEVYKKALELACNEVVLHRIDSERYYGEDTECVVEEMLEKASEEQ